MKNILAFAAILTLVSCQEEVAKDYVSFSGKITNKNSDEIRITGKDYEKTIAVNEDGTFSDTLKVEKGMYSFYDGSEGTSLFLENGYDLTMELDTKMFDETIKYSGIGEENNNFLAAKALFEEKTYDVEFDNLDRSQLESTVAGLKSKVNAFLDEAVDIDTMLIRQSRERLDGTVESIEKYYGGIIALKEDFPAGSASPEFHNYENFKGGTTSLADLRGKYVYVDIWATWCAPCKAEIPFLKELEAEYHDKNITFVSMSIDDDKRHKGSWEKAHQAWKKMVADKELGGVQIMAPKGWESDFIKDYRINGIPRFILIDPEGNVVDPSAPRPSNPELKTMLETMI